MSFAETLGILGSYILKECHIGKTKSLEEVRENELRWVQEQTALQKTLTQEVSPLLDFLGEIAIQKVAVTLKVPPDTVVFLKRDFKVRVFGGQRWNAGNETMLDGLLIVIEIKPKKRWFIDGYQWSVFLTHHPVFYAENMTTKWSRSIDSISRQVGHRIDVYIQKNISAILKIQSR